MELADLERRIQLLEDRAAIREVIARYAFQVDAGDPPDWGSVFSESIEMEAGQLGTSTGLAEIERRFSRAEHLETIREGSQHGYSNLVIRVDEGGRSALAWGYACVHVRRGGGFEHHTLGVNRWRLAKEDGAWKITHRLRREAGEPGWKNVLRDVPKP
jgi:hypothetical protein